MESAPYVWVTVTIALMVVAGALGSYCRNIFDRDRGITFVRVVIPGIVAAFLVPLFLNIGKSELLSKILKGQDFAENALILFGFCLLAAVTARSFVETLARQALQRAEAAENTAAQASEKAEEAKDIVAEYGEPKLAEAHPVGTQLPLDLDATDAEKAVMGTLLSGDYTRRSLTGIASAANLDKGVARQAIASLIKKGRVVELKSQRTGSLLYQAKLA